MIVIKTVLKSGGEYKKDYVYRMRDMISQYVNCEYKFVCYSDVEIEGVEVRDLEKNLPKWWSKIEIFRDVEESFYIDLDMTIHNDITDIVSCETDFMALKNMNPKIGGIGSAMMKWKGDKRFIYNQFLRFPEEYMEIFNDKKIGTPLLGDQGFIWSLMKNDTEYFQDKFPNKIRRFNQNGGDIKVYFGKYRPWRNV